MTEPEIIRREALEMAQREYVRCPEPPTAEEVIERARAYAAFLEGMVSMPARGVAD